ncbi:hypothetical protein [Pyrinomonas methylaliphatogenes]|uniref:Uncharacterized protein n=1 Tax=Pyrinomonas methylaliphatogenes TaxID=454194 RepID=A0A0B6WSN9_9BACT|nr:hypothetical protein [Pyrinomonas methylaliphatogenes]CDM64248.1 hypothetical protein PYK22_00241 [Pyrinomonas methylaliphatogenes]
MASRGLSEEFARQLAGALDEREEWVCAEVPDGPAVLLRRGEWEVSLAHGQAFLAFWTRAGTAIWRVLSCERSARGLMVEVERRAGAEKCWLRFMPRASEGRTQIEEARRARCAQIVELFRQRFAGARILSQRLSRSARPGEAGRFARILLSQGRTLRAITGPVAELKTHETDAFLASSLIWFARINRRDHSAKLCLAVDSPLAEDLAERVVLLRESWRRCIEVYKLKDRSLEPQPIPSLEDLLADAPPLRVARAFELSQTARRIQMLAPEAVEIARARHGETLRFRGLSFARVRRVVGGERAWFGIERRRQLDESSWPELCRLVEDLRAHRRAGAENKEHAFYRAEPEAWLEFMLKREIAALDANLRLSPLHAQFRVAQSGESGRPIDLIAQRRDGRLVVIELKIKVDAGFVIQGADYWRRIEAQRRKGNLARFFPDVPIADDPPMLYLVAPMLAFPRKLHAIARLIRSEIEIHRIELNEDWRAGVRVVRRVRVGDEECA